MIRIIHTATFAVGLAIVLFGTAFSYSAGLDDPLFELKLRGDGSVDDSQPDRFSSEMKRRGDHSSGDRSDDRDLEEDRRRSRRNRGRDDLGILTRDNDPRDDDRGREDHR